MVGDVNRPHRWSRPQRRSFLFSHPQQRRRVNIDTFTTRPNSVDTPSAASTVIGSGLVADGCRNRRHFQALGGALFSTATSRATPMIPKQSARFGVTLISMVHCLIKLQVFTDIVPSGIRRQFDNAAVIVGNPSSEKGTAHPFRAVSPRSFAALILKSPGKNSANGGTATFSP